MKALEGRAAQLMKSATRLRAPLRPSASGSPASKEGGVTIIRTGSEQREPLRYVWFHGASQPTNNELLSRLANAFHEAGIALEIYSMPYVSELPAVMKIIDSFPGKVLIGGHSAGGLAIDRIIQTRGKKLLGVATINSANLDGLMGRARAPRGVPTLHFIGENDVNGRVLLPDQFQFERAGGQVFVRTVGHARFAVLRQGDHSARARQKGDHDKARAAASPETRAMNLELARTLRSFVQEISESE